MTSASESVFLAVLPSPLAFADRTSIVTFSLTCFADSRIFLMRSSRNSFAVFFGGSGFFFSGLFSSAFLLTFATTLVTIFSSSLGFSGSFTFGFGLGWGFGFGGSGSTFFKGGGSFSLPSRFWLTTTVRSIGMISSSLSKRS